MRTCKDCIHYKVCQSRITYDENFGDSTSFETKCADFRSETDEKQIQKKPIGVYCPVCKNDCDTDADSPFPNYCPNCGQALCWSDK